MKLVFYSLILNHHQASVADELYELLGYNFRFVELSPCNDTKGGTEDYSKRPYLVRSWHSTTEYDEAMRMAKCADVCVFAGYESLPFEKERLRSGKLSFDMGERLLKRGWVNLLSPRILRMVLNYHIYNWRKKPLYKLCCSGFTASDCNRLGMFSKRCYKWGYFTAVDNSSINVKTLSESKPVKIMWCSRLIKLKHPELAVTLARNLKEKGYNFHIDIYGDEGNVSNHEKVFTRHRMAELINQLDVSDKITLHGNVPNNVVIDEMRRHHIFLFTSDKREGWGAVANESLSNGCVLVASDAIGSSPYLIKEGYNGFLFTSCDAYSLTEKVEWLLNNPKQRSQMQRNAINDMQKLWNPHNAAVSLLKLIDALERGETPEISEGPCSKA